MRPAAQDIIAVDHRAASRIGIFIAIVKIALQGEMVLVGGPIINAKPALPHAPGIRRTISVGINLAAAVEILAVDSKKNIGSQRAAITNPGKIAQFRAAARFRINPLGVLGIFGGNVDDAVHGVRPPQRPPGTADHFDPVYVFQQIILLIPKNTRIKRRINTPPVHQYQQLVAQGRIEPARTDRPIMGIFLRHIQIIRQTQCLGNTGSPRTANLITGDDINGGGRLAIRLRFLGHGSDVHIHQFLQVHRLINRRAGQVR